MSSEPPEEPHYLSEPNILSPASPKPIHFPTPTNIPVLEKQMDVAFMQTEPHMNDPAMHNTEVREDFWRDPNEQNEAADNASPYSTGGEAVDEGEQNGTAQAPVVTANGNADSMDIPPIEQNSQPAVVSSSISNEPNASSETAIQTIDSIQPSSDPSVPTADPPMPTAETSQPEPLSIQQQTPFAGAVDVQAILNSLQAAPASAVTETSNTAPLADGMTVATTVFPSSQPQNPNLSHDASAPPPGVDDASSPLSASNLGAPPSGLPPRPPPQEQPIIHPNYVHSQHIRDYHPHASNPAFQPHARTGSQGNVADPNSRNFVPPVHSSEGAAAPGIPQSAGASSYASISTNLPSAQQAPGTAGFGFSPSASSGFAASPQSMYPAPFTSSTDAPTEGRRENSYREGTHTRAEDRPWTQEVQNKYDRFITDERGYVSEGRWEQFPQGSRLFVGNLSSEKVTKRDIFHVFHPYGELAQISIKQAYGFVQFLRTEDCMTALEQEQGTLIRDKKIHLEISKPQKNRTSNVSRRSRSPPDSGRGRQGGNVDRYVSGGRGGNNRRDGYRSGYRSPSPRAYRDRYDDRYRRSRSPDYGRGGGGRYRSPSPRRDIDDDLPLPRRAPRDVPDVQVIVLDSLDRDFISWVEKAFSSRQVRVDVLLLSPRLSEQAVIRRQIMEGVIAVVKLTRQNQNSGRIGLQIFDRTQGANNVKFEEYDDQDPAIAVELVLRAKQAHSAPIQAPGGYGGYGHQYGVASAPPPMPAQQYSGYGSAPPPAGPYGQPQPPSGYPPSYSQAPTPQGAPQPGVAAPGVPPNLQNLITNLDPNNLQNLLSAMNTPQNSANPYANPSQPNSAAAALQNNPALAGYLQQQQQQAQQAAPGTSTAAPGSAGVNMQDILARLGTYQR